MATAGLLAVVEDQRHEKVGVEGDYSHGGEAEEPEGPPEPPESVGQREYGGAHDGGGEVEGRVPPLPLRLQHEGGSGIGHGKGRV